LKKIKAKEIEPPRRQDRQGKKRFFFIFTGRSWRFGVFTFLIQFSGQVEVEADGSGEEALRKDGFEEWDGDSALAYGVAELWLFGVEDFEDQFGEVFGVVASGDAFFEMLDEIFTDRVVSGDVYIGSYGTGGNGGFEEARLDEGDFDAEAVEFVSEGFGVTFEGKFGGGVEAVAGDADAAGEGSDVNDSAFALGTHVRQDGLGEANGAEEVGFEEVVDLIDGGFLGRAIEDDAGVIDEDVDSACAVEDGLDTIGDGVVGSHVERKHGNVADGGWVGFSGGAEDGVAVVGEELGGLEAKACGGAGDEDDALIGVGHVDSFDK
jgi:hypothetical protein